MAPTITPRVPSGELYNKLSRSLTSTFSKMSIRDVASSSAKPLASVFALVVSSSSLSRRALTPLTDLPRSNTAVLTHRSADLLSHANTNVPLLLKRQNAILCIPATYAGLNDGPPPGTVVGATLGAIVGFILIIYIFLLSVQLVSGRGTTVIKEEVIVKRSSRSRSARRSSRHASHHSEHISPAAPPRSRRETIVEVEEEIIRHSSHHRSPSPESPEEVIVEEEESASEEIVEVIEEQSSIAASPSPPPRKPSRSSRQSGFRTVDPAEFGGGDAPMRRMSRRSSGRA